MFSTIGSEGGKFVSKQTEVNQPVLETVGNIGNTISRFIILHNLIKRKLFLTNT